MSSPKTKIVTLDWLCLRPTDTIVFDVLKGVWRNPARVQRVFDFIEGLTVPSGVGAGTPFRLREWQRNDLRDVYEPCDETGRRIVRDAVDSVGRKNGKTARIAALVLVHLVGPESVINGEVYSAANDREQAGIVFKFAAQLVRAEPELLALCDVIDSTKRIACKSNGSFYHALSREAGTKHGLNPTFAIYDELAQAKDRELYDTINTAFGARDEPLFAVISTQSRDPQHLLSELIDTGLSGSDPSVVCHLYAVPDDALKQLYCPACGHRYTPEKGESKACRECGGKTLAGVYDEALWYQANPALGDFLSLASVRKLAKQARDNPSFEPSFLNLSLNMRVDSVPSLINRADWEACHDPDCSLIPGEDIYLGLDLSGTTDLCALVAVSAHGGSRLAAWFWKPKELIQLHATRDRVPYERWALEEYLFPAPGRDVDYDLIVQQIQDLSTEFHILGVSFDRWRIAVLMKCFARLGVPAYYGDDEDGDGIRFVEWGQGYKDMAPAVDALDKAVTSRSLVHPGHPVLTWCVSNAVAVSDPAGNRKLDKSKARFRIDGAVAATMAIGLKSRDMPDADDEGDFDGFLANPISVKVRA